ncbi:MAG: toll/interleukin-1 receptor domain-containing protein [Chloroflexi bacterium]|nr:toll/interleukin-1 receptor domain-containing protein [Chloroflexota bacterium]
MERAQDSIDIFISHSSKDCEIVQSFLDDLLIGSMGFQIRKIFCASIEGTKIESGEDWRNEIRNHLLKAKVIFLIITPNYKSSEMCLNEMGAAWATESKVIPMIVEL